jgi:hypothetical protein
MVKGSHQCPPLVIHEVLGTSTTGRRFSGTVEGCERRPGPLKTRRRPWLCAWGEPLAGTVSCRH